jgi:hypothetical protein
MNRPSDDPRFGKLLDSARRIQARLLDPAYAKLSEVLACVREIALRSLESAAHKKGIGGP